MRELAELKKVSEQTPLDSILKSIPKLRQKFIAI